VTLKIAARYAQYTNFDGTPEGFARKSELLKGHCETVGTDFDAIVRSSNYNVAIGETEADVEKRLQDIVTRVEPYVGAEQAQRLQGQFRDSVACGTPAQIVERLGALRDAGMTYGIFNFSEAAYDRSGIELFEREVLPALA
jgi:alkanesulfonate monooxygenase SsuD/methylene tetrahydromethanopterin reductase-like flavin-dependent oxidoreductase (luciferase family)